MKFNILKLRSFTFNSNVYYLTRTFIVLTRAFNFSALAFNHATCVLKFLTRAFELVTRTYELITQLLTRVLHFHLLRALSVGMKSKKILKKHLKLNKIKKLLELRHTKTVRDLRI